MKNRSLLIITILILFTNIVFAATLVAVVEPEIREINNVRIISSRTEPIEDVQLSVKSGGIIEEVYVQVGDYVKKGQVLLKLDQGDLQIQLQQVEAAVQIAQANYNLMLAGASEEDRRAVEAAYQQALASYEGAKESLVLIEAAFQDRTAQKQQLLAAETQLKAAEKQMELAEENLKQALTGLKQAETEFDRIKYLYAENVASKNQYEMVETQYKNAQSLVESARLAKEQAAISYQGAREGYLLAEENYNNPVQLEQQVTAARSQLKIAEANVEMARANLEKVEKGARPEELRIAEANLKQARSSLEQVKKALEDTLVKSPIDGIIAQLYFKAGEIVGPGTPVANIVNLDQIYINASITEELLFNIEKGQEVRIRVLAARREYLEGLVEYISPVVDPRTQAFTVKVLSDNPEGRLRGGMFTELYIPVAENKSALVLPVAAVLDLARDPHVYIVEEGKAFRRNLETGIIDGDYIEIIRGLKGDEKVVIQGQYNLEDGARVEVVE